MNILSLEGYEYIICICVTVLLCGLIFYYFRNRFMLLEKAHIEMAKTLHRFIAFMQEKDDQQIPVFNGPPQMQGGELASPEVTAAAKQAHSEFNKEQPREKIDVSDDEGSSSYDTESETETDTSSDNEIHTLNIGDPEQVDLKSENIKVVEMSSPNTNDSTLQVMEEVNIEPTQNTDDDDDDDESDDDDDDDDDDEVGMYVEGNDSESGKTCTLVNYQGLKVAALRNVAIEKGLVKNVDDGKKIKKKQLLELLGVS